MRKMSRTEIVYKIGESGLISLFYHKNLALIQKVVQVCYGGGAKFFYFTHEVFTELIRFSRQQCPELILGAGSVADAGTASLYVNLGAEFVISPVLRGNVAMVCNRRKTWKPGLMQGFSV